MSTEAEKSLDRQNADAIKNNEATDTKAKGNVHSEVDEDAPERDSVPPMPN